MSPKEFLRRAREIAEPFCVRKGEGFRLKDVDPDDTLDFKSEDKQKAKEALARGVEMLAAFQGKLYAMDRWAVLLVFQAMDAAGKDSAIKHVMSGLNPQSCQVHSFKAPSLEELDHDYLWRCLTRLPNRGHIGIFNRSYYEETLVVRVHPQFLEKQKLPSSLINKKIWQQRFEDIGNFERYLSHNGIVVRKFFLHVSKKEQSKRFLDRINDPNKNWKFAADDLRERGYWDKYMHAYEQMIQQTATKWAPWYVVPADNKWFTRLIVAAALIDTLNSLDLKYPKVDREQRKELVAARAELLKKASN